MDKISLTNHIKDVDLKNKIFKVIDKANQTLKNYEVNKTDFLNPYEIKNAISVLNYNKDIKYTIDGGYENAERSVIFIYPYYMEYEDIDEKLKYIQIEGNFKFRSVSHKDYLGSVLGLGIKREKVGDIIVHENFAQMVLSSDICDFIVYNLEKISKNNIEVKEISKDKLVENVVEYKEITCTVSSKRLDCIISEIYNISRQESLKYIKSEKVFVNHEKIVSTSKEIQDNALISVRGKSRVIIEGTNEKTSKGKIRLKAKIIV